MKRNILFISSGLVIVDQLIKLLVLNTMYLYQSILAGITIIIITYILTGLTQLH